MVETKPKGELSILLSNVRLSFFYGFTPMEGKNDQGKITKNWCTHGIMAPAHPDLPKLIALMKQAARNAWGDQAEAVYKQLKGQDRLCVHNGDISKPGMDGYGGMYYVSANSPKRVTIIDGDRTPLTEEDGRPYSGCYANIKVNIWPQHKGSYGKRINAQLMGVQFVAHGDAFGGGRIASPEEFGIVAMDADGSEPPDSDVDDLIG